MNKIQAIRASILEAMTAGTDETEDLNKSAEDALAEAVQSYLTASIATASKSTPKAKTIKEKGIALCHQSQGYSANLRPVSLMMKSKFEDLTEEQRAALKRLGYVINQGV